MAIMSDLESKDARPRIHAPKSRPQVSTGTATVKESLGFTVKMARKRWIFPICEGIGVHGHGIWIKTHIEYEHQAATRKVVIDQPGY